MKRLASVLALACSLSACKPAPSPAASSAIADAGPDLDKLDPGDPKQLLALVDKMGGQIQGRPKSFEVLAALGNLYYENGRYLDAVDSYRQALELADPLEARERALRLKGVKPAAELPL